MMIMTHFFIKVKTNHGTKTISYSINSPFIPIMPLLPNLPVICSLQPITKGNFIYTCKYMTNLRQVYDKQREIHLHLRV